MTTTCKNCNHQFEENFCNRCGQPAATHELNMHYIWHDLQHGLLHVDHGIFYTIGQLLSRPGHTVRDFIDGKRVRHFKPVALVVILATLYGLLFHYFIGDLIEVEPIGTKEGVVDVYSKVIQWITKHLAYAALLSIISTTLVSYKVFKKQGHNFAEHLVLNTFTMGLILVVNLLLLPVLFIQVVSEQSILYASVSQLLYFLLMYWCYAQFFNHISWLKTLGLTLLTFWFMSLLNLGVGYLVSWFIILF